MAAYASYTNKGGRQENEDTVKICRRGGVLCVAVADGLGGHGGGRTASRRAVKAIMSQFRGDQEAESENLSLMLQNANEAVMAAQTESVKMMTTAALLVLDENRACTATIGDTRLYHFIDGKLAYQSTDHSMPQLAVMLGEIRPDEIRSHPDRNRLTRALGGGSVVSPDVQEAVNLEPGLHAFLLCTDGFWEYVTEDEMAAELTAARTPSAWLKGLRRLLKPRAPENNDNNTAAAVFLEL